MKLIRCTVKGFGALHEVTFDFCDGLNVLRHDNGWGKTTLSSFLKAMLYGLAENRKRDLSENERTRFLPWDGTVAGGALVYESEGRTYRVERTFHKKSTGTDDTCVLYDDTTGERLPAPDCLGEELFGIDADGFERTVFLSERALAGKNENKSIAAKLSDLVGTDGDIGTLDGALKSLDDRRREYYKRTGGGAINRAEEELRSLTLALHELTEQLAATEATAADQDQTGEEIDALRAHYRALNDRFRTLPGPEAGELLAAQEESCRKSCDALRVARDKARARFGAAVPSAADITAAEAADSRLSTARARREAAEGMAQATRAFFARPTSEEELVSVRRTLNARPLALWVPVALFALSFISLLGILVHPAMLMLTALLAACGALTAYSCVKGQREKQQALKILSSYPTASRDPHLAFEEIFHKFANISLQNEQHRAENSRDSTDADEQLLRRFCEDFGIREQPISLPALREGLTELQVIESRLADEELRAQTLAAQRAAATASFDPQARAELEAQIKATHERLDELIRLQQRQAMESTRLEGLALERERIEGRIEELKEQKQAYEREHTVILRTVDYLKEAARRLTAKYKEKTEAGFERYLALLGKGSEDYQLSTAFELRLDEAGTYRALEGYSRGTKDLYNLALRLGLIDALFDKEQPPLILDDPFAALDDTRLAQAKALLRALGKERQILYFTCTEGRVP